MFRAETREHGERRDRAETLTHLWDSGDRNMAIRRVLLQIGLNSQRNWMDVGETALKRQRDSTSFSSCAKKDNR